MQERLRMEVGDDFVVGLNCAICTASALRVNHLSKFADYISCDECGSSFVIEEDGDRVLYGKIADEYTDTEKVVLKNWMPLTVVERLAGSERLRKELGGLQIPRERRPEQLETQLDDRPVPDQETPDENAVMEAAEADLAEEPEDLPLEEVEFRLEDRLGAVTDSPIGEPEMDLEVIDALDVPDAMALEDLESDLPDSQESGVEVPVVLPLEKASIDAPVGARMVPSPPDWIEPDQPSEPGEETPVVALPEKYYRVCIEGEGVYFPMKACVHCMQTPVSRRINIVGSLPAGDSVDRRRRAVFSVPLCMECSKKRSERSEALKNAQLQAHLTAVVVGLALVVAALGLGVVDIGSNAPLGLFLLGIIGGAGYLLPAGLLLARTQRIPPPLETHLVRTTLSVRGPEEPAAETNFYFRNQEYAQIFLDSNPKAALGKVEELLITPESLAPQD